VRGNVNAKKKIRYCVRESRFEYYSVSFV